jgi:hypothetical protein
LCITLLPQESPSRALLFEAASGVRLDLRLRSGDHMNSPAPRVRLWHIVVGIVVAALIGFAVFGLLAWRSVKVERAEPDDALNRFEQVRRQFSSTEPILRVDPNGRTLRQPSSPNPLPPPNRLHVLAYRAANRRLVRADVPFWFVKIKGPAMQYVLDDTGFDLERLGITPTELERYGQVLILDEARENGDRLLVWTQ